ncbi:MAG: enoyl-CoA hydratase/isomerase family protein [Actinomycetota bacterium]|nr:enoyl-CoA hydratase/isomerase family protein [Actinomycetota bacterium]
MHCRFHSYRLVCIIADMSPPPGPTEPPGRAVVVYDHADRGNSLDQPRLESLVDALEQAAGQPGCRVIHLEMAGPHFCGGWDTRTFSGMAGAEPATIAADLRASDETLDRIRRLPVPVVAGVRGRVIGFGVGLLSAIHLPIAATGARASLPEATFGFAPAGVGHLVATTLPRAHAYALLTAGSTASAEDLHRWGLVSQVVPDGELDSAVAATVAGLAALPEGASRAVTAVIESSRSTGRPDGAYQISARSIAAARPIGGDPR